ncbi:MAG TPA: hypothetical protein HA257_10325 [Candidatus Methanoperedenaceae archaeon]|nr:hypothetical protein [Candidatus Methanoperedenaceae archaeon]
MKTGNFDIVVEANEELVNRAVGALFYKGFLDIRGSYGIPVEDVPASMSEFTKIDYMLKLKDGPTVDFIRRDNVGILISAEAIFNVLDGIELEFDVDFSIEASLVYDRNTNKLVIDLSKAKISDIDINDEYDLPVKVLNKFNEIIRKAIQENLTDKYTSIDVTPTLFSLDLPDMPPGDENKLTINMGTLKVLNNNVAAVCVNLLNYAGGNTASVVDFTEDKNLAVGITENAMHRVFDFWWDRTTNPKSITASDTYDVPYIDTFLNFIGGATKIATALATLGILETDFTTEDVWMEYGATVRFRKPDFDLKSGNILEVDGSLRVDVWATVKARVSISIEVDTSGFIPDDWTPWEDDVVLEKKTSVVTLLGLRLNDLGVTIDKAQGHVFLDNENRLMGDLEDIDLSIDLGNEWYTALPEYVLNVIIDFVEGLVESYMPPIVLSPALITEDVPGTGLAIEADIDVLDVFDDEVIVAAGIKVKGLPRNITPVPRYIANTNPEALEVHRSDCPWVEEMNEEHKTGYFILYDALKDGYNGCKYCLPKYHTR